MIFKINEKSAFDLSLTFRDKDNALEIPASVHYQIDCVTTGAAIRAETALAGLASSMVLPILPVDTTLQSQDNESELRAITFTMNQGLDTQFIEVFRYEAINRRAIT